MIQLAVLSGKGGTGKTTVASSLIRLSENRAFADCDVEAPNLHQIFVHGEKPAEKPYYGLKKAVLDPEACTGCGKCAQLCRFDAIQSGHVNPFLCEGCGVCETVCPVHGKDGHPAIHLEDQISGKTLLFQTESGVLSTAELQIGSGASGRMVSEVRANLYSALTDEKLVILDGSPGIGCPVIASVTGTQMVLIVAEPTLSGIHDMQRIIETARRFDAKIAVCINKFDSSPNGTKEIQKFCLRENISVLGLIPFDHTVIKAVNSGKPVVDFPDSKAGKAIREIWGKLEPILAVS
jgi:MinD superfamily P-loop ATPase